MIFTTTVGSFNFVNEQVIFCVHMLSTCDKEGYEIDQQKSCYLPRENLFRGRFRKIKGVLDGCPCVIRTMRYNSKAQTDFDQI